MLLLLSHVHSLILDKLYCVLSNLSGSAAGVKNAFMVIGIRANFF